MGDTSTRPRFFGHKQDRRAADGPDGPSRSKKALAGSLSPSLPQLSGAPRIGA